VGRRKPTTQIGGKPVVSETRQKLAGTLKNRENAIEKDTEADRGLKEHDAALP
jgi:hypothetical protein